mmetsp:Transcript_25617/g.71441  ORF Transcript_25617/g.71441 Transcript_25617/m.71441 type:complete len:334 (+) Transcript_25617:709-1710(+)
MAIANLLEEHLDLLPVARQQVALFCLLALFFVARRILLCFRINALELVVELDLLLFVVGELFVVREVPPALAALPLQREQRVGSFGRILILGATDRVRLLLHGLQLLLRLLPHAALVLEPLLFGVGHATKGLAGCVGLGAAGPGVRRHDEDGRAVDLRLPSVVRVSLLAFLQHSVPPVSDFPAGIRVVSQTGLPKAGVARLSLHARRDRCRGATFVVARGQWLRKLIPAGNGPKLEAILTGRKNPMEPWLDVRRHSRPPRATWRRRCGRVARPLPGEARRALARTTNGALHWNEPPHIDVWLRRSDANEHHLLLPLPGPGAAWHRTASTRNDA